MIGYNLERRGSLEIRSPKSRGGIILDLDGQGEWGVMEIGQFSWTSYVYHPLEFKLLKL